MKTRQLTGWKKEGMRKRKREAPISMERPTRKYPVIQGF